MLINKTGLSRTSLISDQEANKMSLDLLFKEKFDPEDAVRVRLLEILIEEE